MVEAQVLLVVEAQVLLAQLLHRYVLVLLVPVRVVQVQLKCGLCSQFDC
jgi:hypothetical protein